MQQSFAGECGLVPTPFRHVGPGAGATLAQAARVCLTAGARSVDAIVTHALCSQADLEVLREAGVARFWSTDTLEHPSNAVPLAPVLAAGLREHGLLG